jgi:cytochrome c-type biogenesis protein
MEQLFTILSRAVEATPIVALAAAAAWGVLSIILSPCHLASIPLIVGFIDRQGPLPPRRAALIATLFAGGILLTIAAIGAITAAAGECWVTSGRGLTGSSPRFSSQSACTCWACFRCQSVPPPRCE